MSDTIRREVRNPYKKEGREARRITARKVRQGARQGIRAQAEVLPLPKGTGGRLTH